jgi:hypothetical protein
MISAIVVGLCCVPAVPDVAGSSGAVRERVVIECVGSMRFGPPGPARGRCTITGAITDRGWFVDGAPRWVHPHPRTFTSVRGTIEMSVYEARGRWRITGGTRVYSGLRGDGWEALFLSLPGRLSFTMTGTVVRPRQR